MTKKLTKKVKKKIFKTIVLFAVVILACVGTGLLLDIICPKLTMVGVLFGYLYGFLGYIYYWEKID